VLGSTDQETAIEEPLPGGELTPVVKVGNTVRRAGVGPWTPAVHALLRHLEAVGFDGSPRVLGCDERGREMLAWVPGGAGVAPLPDSMTTEEALASVGELLRSYHEAAASFVPPPDARWRYWLGAPTEGDVVCHNDLVTPNVVFRDGRAAAFIDWDFAAPAPRIYDIASAAKNWVPLVTDEHAAESGWPAELHHGPRLRSLCDAYGLERRERARLLDVAILRGRNAYASLEAWARTGGGFARLWHGGRGERILRDMRWIESHRAELERHLLG
jgi:hypothetical protein